MKKCVVETINGFRVFGKVVNNNIPIELTSREILDVIRRTGVRCYELLGDQKIRLTMENYNIANILPGIVASEVDAVDVEPVATGDGAVNFTAETESGKVEETDEDLQAAEEPIAESVEEVGSEAEVTEDTVDEEPAVEEIIEEPAVEELPSEEPDETPVEEKKVEAPKNNFNSKFPTASKNNSRH